MSFLDRLISRLEPAPHSPEADQAIIDLLHLVMLADRMSSVAERDRIGLFVVSRQWPTGHNPEAYAQKSLSAAREIMLDEARLDAALDSVVNRLMRSEHRSYAIELARELAEVDGTLSPTELAIVTHIARRIER